jgi:hypothetical protein
MKYSISLTASFHEIFIEELKRVFQTTTMSWPAVNSVGLDIWQSMALRRFAACQDSYYIGRGLGSDKDTLCFQGNTVIIHCVAPANPFLVFLLEEMLESVAVEYELDVQEIEDV